MPDPIGSEFGIVIAEMNYGYDLRGALENLADAGADPGHPDVRRVGRRSRPKPAATSPTSSTASRVIRERASMVLKVRALASEGKMTGTCSASCRSRPSVSSSPRSRISTWTFDDPLFLPGAVAVCVWYVTRDDHDATSDQDHGLTTAPCSLLCSS